MQAINSVRIITQNQLDSRTHDAEEEVEQSRHPPTHDQSSNRPNESNTSEGDSHAIKHKHSLARRFQNLDAVFDLIGPFDV